MWDNDFFISAGGAAQLPDSFPYCCSTLFTLPYLVHQHLHLPCHRAVSQLGRSQLVLHMYSHVQDFVRFHRLLLAASPSLPRSPCRVSLPFKMLDSQLIVESLANLDRVQSILIFHITCEAIEQCWPLRVPVVAGYHFLKGAVCH